jgi:hypothetical protein
MERDFVWFCFICRNSYFLFVRKIIFKNLRKIQDPDKIMQFPNLPKFAYKKISRKNSVCNINFQQHKISHQYILKEVEKIWQYHKKARQKTRNHLTSIEAPIFSRFMLSIKKYYPLKRSTMWKINFIFSMKYDYIIFFCCDVLNGNCLSFDIII